MDANNVVVLTGNLCRDAEVRVTPKGTAVVSFGLAVNRRWKDPNGQAAEKVTFVDCEMWGKTGEVFAKYHKKGDRASVLGRLEMDQWEDKTTNQKRTRLKVVAESFTFVNSRKSGGAEESAGDEAPASQPPARQPRPRPPQDLGPLEDDVPF